jgi:hypothetical protein
MLLLLANILHDFSPQILSYLQFPALLKKAEICNMGVTPYYIDKGKNASKHESEVGFII